MMSYYVFDIWWSQSDRDTIIVKAETLDIAILMVEQDWRGYSHLECVRTVSLPIVKN